MLGFEFKLGGSALVIFVIGVALVIFPILKGEDFLAASGVETRVIGNLAIFSDLSDQTRGRTSRTELFDSLADRLATANEHMVSYRLDEAITAYRALAEDLPDDRTVLNNLAVALSVIGERDSALAVLARAPSDETVRSNECTIFGIAAEDCEDWDQPKPDLGTGQLLVVRAHLEDLRVNLQSIRDRVHEDDHADAVEHADEMHRLVQEARLAAVQIPGDKGERIVQDLNDLQLAIDKLKDVAGELSAHDEIEHAIESVDEGLLQLDEDISS